MLYFKIKKCHFKGPKSLLYVPIATGGSNTESIGWTPVLAFVQVPLHIPSPTEGLSARRTPMSSAVNMSMMLKRTRMLEDLAAFVTRVTTHTI